MKKKTKKVSRKFPYLAEKQYLCSPKSKIASNNVKIIKELQT